MPVFAFSPSCFPGPDLLIYILAPPTISGCKLQHSQLGVVMRLIASLSSDRIPDDIEEKYRFRSRARVLYEQWIDSLPALNRPLDPQWANRNGALVQRSPLLSRILTVSLAGEHDRVRRWRCNLQRSFLTPSRPAEDEVFHCELVLRYKLMHTSICLRWTSYLRAWRNTTKCVLTTSWCSSFPLSSIPLSSSFDCDVSNRIITGLHLFFSSTVL